MSLPINKWSVQDRPREKFSANGRKSLSDAELLAIIIGNGQKIIQPCKLLKRSYRTLIIHWTQLES